MTNIDPARTVPLDNGYLASVCVTPTGRTVLWLLAEDSPETDDDYGCACVRCAPHEHPCTPLPPRILDALRTHRCGQPRLDGHPCRIPVSAPGAACHHHRHREGVRP